MSENSEKKGTNLKTGDRSSSRAKVALAPCPSYESSGIVHALEFIVDRLAGLKTLIGAGKRVFVKINHLSPSSPPERAILTHPVFAREVLRLILEAGGRVMVGDDIQGSPGNGFTKSGYRALCSELGIPLVNLKETGFVEIDVRGELLKKTYIARPVLEADVIVNLPKLKTHSFTIFTGAIKNMFGVIPHGLRLNYHRQFVRSDVFARMLVDLFSCVPPQLNFMDAIVAMEGEGPSAGSPRPVGLILASDDAVALDAVASHVVGLEPFAVPTTAIAHARKLGVGDIREIDILGPSLADVVVKDFKHSVAAVSLFRRLLPSLLYAYFQEQLVLIPKVRPESCTGCQECIRICPRQAIHLVANVAFIRDADCIHCLCCHEVCQDSSIKLTQRLFGRLIRKGEAMLNQIDKIWAVFKLSPAQQSRGGKIGRRSSLLLGKKGRSVLE